MVGLPNAGKTTVFRALTRLPAEVGDYPFTTIEPQTGLAEIEDERLPRVAALAGSARLTPAAVEVVDVAGLVEGASRGEGLGNRFLAHVREVDAVFHVVRCFADPRVPHVAGEPSPCRDAELVDTELALADLDILARRREKVASLLKSGEARWRKEAHLLEQLEALLQKGIPARLAPGEDLVALARGLNLLTVKPVLYVANVGEEGSWGEDWSHELLAYARERQAPAEKFFARAEAELAELEPADRAAMAEALGWPTGGGQRLLQAGYRLLDLVTFFTANEKECRARSLRRGATAREAAAHVHTDMAEGFIRAEVISCSDLFRAGSFTAARERGLVRTEGRDYLVQDGDVIVFRFHR